MSLSWSAEVEELLEKLRVNAVNMSEYHRKRFYHYKGFSKYFRIPLIVLASINATASVGLQPVLPQPIISGITCLIGMTMGIIGSIELYLGIQSNMELELTQSKEFYTLSIEIFKIISLRRENRPDDGKEYLNATYSRYIKLVETSNLMNRKMKIDLLTTIPNQYVDNSRATTPSPSTTQLYQAPRNSLNIDDIRAGLSQTVQQNMLDDDSLTDETPNDNNFVEA
jgi:hypothetical protein